MAFTVRTHSLSSISPIRFAYEYNENKETLANEYVAVTEKFGYLKHKALTEIKDIALSKKNCLMLTSSQSMSGIFAKDPSQNTKRDYTNTTSTVVLKSEGKEIIEANGFLYKGGPGGCGTSDERLLITIFPVGNGYVELRVGKTGYITVDDEYPYTARLTTDPMDVSEYYSRRFKIEQSSNIITLAKETVEGFRYLAFGIDGVLRAIGLVMNNTVINSYYFEVENLSFDQTTRDTEYGFSVINPEVKYFNELLDTTNRSNLEIDKHKDTKTNLLITCPTHEMVKTDEATINISLLRTNYSAEGSFLYSI